MTFRNLARAPRATRRAFCGLAAGVIFAANVLEGLAAASNGNLIKNGDFETLAPPRAGTKSVGAAEWTGSDERATPGDATSPNARADSQAKPFAGRASQACTVSGDQPHAGKQSFLLQRTGERAHNFTLTQKNIPLRPGGIYRLRFWARADRRAADMGAVCFNSSGPEGPAWPIKPIYIEKPDVWQPQEILFRAQSGFNGLNKTDLEFRLYQWQPGKPASKEVQRLWIDDVVLEPMPAGEAASARIIRWLLLPNRSALRYADVELSLGDGVIAEDASVELYRDGAKLTRVESLEQIGKPGQYAYSGRSRRVYVSQEAASGRYEFHFKPVVNAEAGAYLNMPPLGASRAVKDETSGGHRVQLDITDPPSTDRSGWPVRQGVPFPRGALADVSEIRILDGSGKEIPSQARATSYWEDDSVRWALLDFDVDIKAGEKSAYALEYGPEIRPMAIAKGIQVAEDDRSISVDTGAMKFTVSKEHFHLFENVEVDGVKALGGAPMLKLVEDTGKVFTADGQKPYLALVEEQGPMHVVIAVLGWNTNAKGEKLCTYTARIHAYRGQKFVRVFYTLTNRNADNVMGKHKVAVEGFPKDTNTLATINLPQRNIADAGIVIPFAAEAWELPAGTNQALTGDFSQGPVIHRQSQRATGELHAGSSTQKTGALPGVATLRGSQATMTVAVYNYANLFPKEFRLAGQNLEVGLLPFSKEQPHGLLQGTARTTELMFAFEKGQTTKGQVLAENFVHPIVFANPAWYCASQGFMNDTLVPANDKTVGMYDVAVRRCLSEVAAPLGPEVDDCGLMNYGDFPYGAYNRWVNLEYDGDLGMYIMFARSGDTRALLLGQDSSRHFLDCDTGWYTGKFETHGANFPHNYVHFDPHPPSGHTYTVGLMHYYLLTGDRRGLEATRMNAEACYRVMYFAVKVSGSDFPADEVVAVPRRMHANNRHRSDPARYPLATYEVTGEPRFLETTLSVADQLAGMTKAWFGHDDMYIHYRWPLVLSDLYQMTGREDYKRLLVDCGDWTLKVPYSLYGEYRAAQCYGGRIVPENNTRMMFQTIYAYQITGERKYLDWTMNMYDQEVERSFGKNLGGKGFGKFGENPARMLPFIVPNRMVSIQCKPARFQFSQPTNGIWQISVANKSETPIEGTVELTLPPGVKMGASQNFGLKIKEEKTLEFPVEFTDEIASGRTTVPYVVHTSGQGRKGERNGFFAVHVVRRQPPREPELLFHATLDDNGPAMSAAGKGQGIFEQPADFVPGKVGRAIGPKCAAFSFNLGDNLRADAGTVAMWIRTPGRNHVQDYVHLWGAGNAFIFFDGRSLNFGGTKFPCHYAKDTVDRWHHYVITWDLDSMHAYVDGELATGCPAEGYKRTTLELPLGRMHFQTANLAAFDDIRIYSAPISPTQIKDLCAALTFGAPAPEAIVPRNLEGDGRDPGPED